MSKVNERVADLMREAAALHVLPRWRHLGAADVWRKADGEVVTVVDIETEAWLAPRLAALVPGSTVIGEEAVANQPRILAGIAEHEAMWLVDPVDGTRRYVAGGAEFAMIVALVRGGETALGWIYEPADDRLSFAERGAGTAIGTETAKLTPADAERSQTGVGGPRFQRVAQKAPSVIAGIVSPNCAGVQYRAMAQGAVDFSVYRRLMPWDHAAGSLMVCEAGGVSAHFDARPYDPVRSGEGLLNARDDTSWRRLSDVFRAA